MMRKRVVITGCSGFIGSRLAIRFSRAGHEVTATARQPSAALEQALKMPVHLLDVLNPATMSAGLEADVAVHCATANDIVSRDFEAGLQLSAVGTRHILEWAVRQQIPRVIFLSTLQVYGTELRGEITEDTPPRCETPYALNHWIGEEVCRMQARKHRLDAILLRPANVYGVPDAPTVERSTLVPMCFVREALQTGRIALRSSGRQQRNFISTDELADACLALLTQVPPPSMKEKDAGADAGSAWVVNAGSRWLASIGDIAAMVATAYRKRTGRDLAIQFGSDEPRDRNEFLLRSRLDSIIPPAETSAAAMADVIERLFEYYPPSP